MNPRPDPFDYALALGGAAAFCSVLLEATGSSQTVLTLVVVSLVGVVARTLVLAPVVVALAAVMLVAPSQVAPPGRASFLAPDLVMTAGVLSYFAGLARLADRRTLGETGRVAPRIGLTILAAVVLGQLGVWLVGRFDLTLQAENFLTPVRSTRLANDGGRWAVALLAFFAVSGVGGFLVWYTRLVRQSPDQARLVLLDTLWKESRRELSRQAIFRARATRVRTPISRRRLLVVGLSWLTLATLTAVVLYRFLSSRPGSLR